MQSDSTYTPCCHCHCTFDMQIVSRGGGNATHAPSGSAPQSASTMPVSSCTSRTAQSTIFSPAFGTKAVAANALQQDTHSKRVLGLAGDAPSSKPPPGKDHHPTLGGFARLISSTCAVKVVDVWRRTSSTLMSSLAQTHSMHAYIQAAARTSFSAVPGPRRSTTAPMPTRGTFG
jgi:hypothetical protein